MQRANACRSACTAQRNVEGEDIGARVYRACHRAAPPATLSLSMTAPRSSSFYYRYYA